MKSIFVILAVCFVGAFAGITEEQRAKLKEYKSSCITETGVDPAVIENIKQGKEVAFDEKVNCFSACMLKKIGIMTPDGVIDEAVARSKVPQDVPKEKVDEVINKCKVEVGSNTCETGGKVLGCLLQSKAFSILK